jgi:hypothetical protein
VAAFFDKLEAGAGLRLGRDNSRRAGGDEWGEIGSQYESESVQRRCLVVVRTLDFAFARLVHMGVVVMMRVQMRVDQASVVTGITMDVLKRRQNKGGRECQTALERYSTPHQPQFTPVPGKIAENEVPNR